MSRSAIDIDGEMLRRAHRALGTTTTQDTVHAALALAATVSSEQRAHLLDSFRSLLARLDAQPVEPPQDRSIR